MGRGKLSRIIAGYLLILSAMAQGDERPNFLFFFADDQRADTISEYGNKYIDTPVLDGLVRRGFNFRRNYCMGSPHGAVCIPSRAMVLSGQAYFRMPLDLHGVDTLPQSLHDAGYTTFITGKWHNEPPSLLRSFDLGDSIMLGGMSNHLEVPLVDIQTSARGEKRLGNRRYGEGFSTEIFADAAIRFISGYDGDAPFYCYLPFTAPHDPRQPPEPYRGKYYANRPPLPPNFLPQHPFDNGSLLTRDENLAPWPRTEDVIRDQLAEYYGMVEHLDAQIGRVLDALAASPHANNTYIIFAADHGLAMGSHGLLGKQNLYEHSMRAPMIVSGPGVPAGHTSALTYLLDLPPTIAQLAGLEAIQPVDGLDLAPLWRGEREKLRDDVLLAHELTQRALVQDRWKLVRFPRVGVTQLFDLHADPHEMHNLAHDPAQADRIAAMMDRLADLQRELGDSTMLELPVPPGVGEGLVDLTGIRGDPDPWQPEWIVQKYFLDLGGPGRR